MYMYVSTLTPWKYKCEQVSQVTLSRTEVSQNDCCNNGEMVPSDVSVNFLSMPRVLSRGVPPF